MKLKHPKKLFVSLLAGVLTLCPLFGSFENIKASSAETDFISDTDEDGRWHINEKKIVVNKKDIVVDSSNVDSDLPIKAEIIQDKDGNYVLVSTNDIDKVPLFSDVYVSLKLKGEGLDIKNMRLTAKFKEMGSFFNKEYGITHLMSFEPVSFTNESNDSWTVQYRVPALSEKIGFTMPAAENVQYLEGTAKPDGAGYCHIEVNTPGEDLHIRAPHTFVENGVDYEKWAKRLAIYANSLSETTGVKRDNLIVMDCHSDIIGLNSGYTSCNVIRFGEGTIKNILDYVSRGENRLTWTEMHEIAHGYDDIVVQESFIWGMDVEGTTDELLTNLRGLTAIQNCDNLCCNKPHDGTKECTETGCTNIITDGYVLPYDRVMDIHQNHEGICIALAARFANIANGYVDEASRKEVGWNINESNWNAENAQKNGWNVLETFYNPPETYKYSDNEEAIRTFRAFIGKSFKKDAIGYKKFAMILYALYDIAQDKGVISSNMKFSDFLTEAFGTYQGDSIIKQFFNQKFSSNTATGLKITKQPQNATALNGEVITIAVGADGADGDGLTYNWYSKNQDQDQDQDQERFSPVPLFKNSTTYFTTKNELVYCEITDKDGNIATTNTVTLSIAKLGDINLDGSIDPIDASIVLSASSAISVGEDPNLTSAEMKRGDVNRDAVLDSKDAAIILSYDAKVSVGYDKSLEEFLNSGIVVVVKQPTNASAEIGKIVSTKVETIGKGLKYQWYVKNPNQTYFAKSSITTDTYSYEMVASKDGRQVYCVITDMFGNMVETDTVTLGTPVKLLEQPKNVVVPEGTDAKIVINAKGIGLTYKWYYKNKGESKFYYTGTFKSNIYSALMNETRDGRQVYCVISDLFGNSVVTEPVTLIMGNPVKLLEQPKNVVVSEGTNANIVINATGDNLTYKWYYKNKGAAKFAYTSTFTSKTYSVVMNDARDGRQVYCVISDQYGNSVQTDTVTLTMSQ